MDLRDIPPRTANFQFAPRSLRSLACRFFFCFNSLFFDSVRGGVSYLRRARYVACKPKALETSHELSARGLFQTACDSA